MENIKIVAPEGYTVDKEKSTYEEIVFKKIESINTLQDVFRLNNTTEESFNSKYNSFEDIDKYSALERMIVKAYNGDWKPNWNDSKQSKYYPWFYLGDDFRFDYSYWYASFSDVAASLCFRKKEDLEDAVIKFIDVYKKSRL